MPPKNKNIFHKDALPELGFKKEKPIDNDELKLRDC
jgi:hypothetical protein